MEFSEMSLSRRRFVEAIGAVAATNAGVYLTGCGSQRASDASSGNSTSDTITYAQGAEPRSLDPALYDDGESAKPAVNIYENLLKFKSDSCEVEPQLAESYDVSDDGLTYTFHLREGVKFHNGETFSADDVVATISRQLEANRTEDMPYASFVYGTPSEGTGVVSVQATDSSTVTIKLAAAQTPFLKNLAMCIAAPIVSKKALEEHNNDLSENPVGTGPYKFKSWTKGQNVVLEAFEDYWDTENKPKTKNVVFSVIAENSSRVTALNNGEADLIDGIDDSVVDQITSAGNEVFTLDGMNINYMAFNTTSETFKTVEARKAVAKAINVEELVGSLYGEYASVANSVMPTWMAPYDEDITQIAYDPEAAKSELAALGITQISCITYSNPRPYNTKGGQVLAEAVQGYLSEVGVTMDIQTFDWTTYKTKIETETYDVCFYGWNGDNGDPDNFMNLLSDSNVSMNVSRFDDSEYKALIDRGVSTPEGSSRDEIYKQLEQMVVDKQPWMLISHAKNLVGYNPACKGWIYHPTAVVFLKGATKA